MRVEKGMRVRVSFLSVQTDPPASLAGVQLKFGATRIEFTGIVRHVRGDAPTEEESKEIRLWVSPDSVPNGLKTEWCEKCGCIEAKVLPVWVQLEGT